MRSLFIGLVATLLLSACSYFNGEQQETILPGERISVLDLQKELTPLATAEATPIEIAPTANNEDWPQSGGYPHHIMQNLSLGQIANLERIWSEDAGKGSDDKLPLNAPPVIANGAVFTLDSNLRVSAFHTQTGQKFWAHGYLTPHRRR